MRTRKELLALILPLVVAAVFLGGCGDGDSGDEPPEATLPQLEEGWNIIYPGGETVCSRGTEYAYAVHPGTVNKLVIDFMGGGACWDDLTCSVAGAIFNEAVDPDELLSKAAHGIYDRPNPDNPFKDWYHVFIPYCTGDVHWGNNVVTYGSGANQFTINHKGAVNAGAVMNWVYDNFGNPETIFITGCSAGAYGSIIWAPHIMDHYRFSKIYQMGDSGAGIITDTFFRQSFPSWNALAFFPNFIPGLDPANVDIYAHDLSYIYGQVGEYFSQHKVSQYNSAFDENQTFYFTAMGGQGGQTEWSRRMFAITDEANQQAPNYYSYIAPGEVHCIIPYDGFYTVEAGGVPLRDWVDDLVNGRAVSDVSCGTQCGSPSS